MSFKVAFRPGIFSSTSSMLGLCSTRSFTSSAPTFARRLPAHSPLRTAAVPLYRRPVLLTTLTASIVAFPYLTSPTIRHDSSPDFSSSAYSHGRDAKVPLSKDGGRSLNPAAIRQISFGGLLGLGLGVIVSAFSKMLVLLLGVGIVASQYAARRGYNIIPVDKLQRHVKGFDLRRAINDNVAFKISFGLMFALTAFGDL